MTYYIGALKCTPYLEHHGILGQKWGVQNGPPYPLGQGDHSKSEQKAGWRKSLDNSGSSSESNKTKKKKRPMTDSEKAALRKKIFMGIAVASTATIVGVAVYNRADRAIIDNMDQILKSGVTLKRVADNDDTSLERAFYAVKEEKDYKKYEGLLGAGQLRRKPGFLGFGMVDPDKHIFRKDIPVLKDIKAPSTKVAEETFKEVFGSNKEALNKINKLYTEEMNQEDFSYDDLSNSKQLRNTYEAFNRLLVYHDDPDFQKNYIEKFYDVLKAKGYGAVLDINDYEYSGYDTKRPMIIFDLDSVSNAICKELDSDTLDEAESREQLKLAGKGFIDGAKWYVPVGAASAAFLSYGDELNYKNQEKQKAKEEQKKNKEANGK